MIEIRAMEKGLPLSERRDFRADIATFRCNFDPLLMAKATSDGVQPMAIHLAPDPDLGRALPGEQWHPKGCCVVD